VATETERHLRADAVRNADRILRAARVVFAESGPDASLEDIARHAGVGGRTLYRHFPTKAALARAAIDQSVAEDLTPAIDQALGDDDPWRGFVSLLEAAMTLAVRERNTLAAARTSGVVTADASAVFFDSLTRLLHRAQQAGAVRAEVVPDDLPRLMAMLFSTVWTMAPDSGGWRRYLVLVLDGLSATAADPLPPAPAVRMQTRPHGLS